MGPRLLEAFADAFPRAFFIEIGANDGVEDDHLRPFIVENEWSGIMVEPVPHLFERLRRNYAGLERVVLENVAIADRDGRVPFYHPPEGDFDKIGSFSRETTLRLARALQFPDLDDRIVTTEVPCLSFESLCRRHHVERLDLLVVDTEGYDFEILKRSTSPLTPPVCSSTSTACCRPATVAPAGHTSRATATPRGRRSSIRGASTSEPTTASLAPGTGCGPARPGPRPRSSVGDRRRGGRVALVVGFRFHGDAKRGRR
jgi:FkbM family methyltransferase